MKHLLKISFLFIIIFSPAANAQMQTETDTISGNTYTISMDKKVSDLLAEYQENCTETGTKPNINVPGRNLSKAELCQQNPKIMGYKIQIAVVNNNDEARDLGLEFRKKFPNMKVEIDASLRPNYRIMAGSYFTKESASGDLKKVKEFFKSAIPVQYRVFCVEAK
ncbi:MAG: SPOR domain-containing protein [Flavobacteriaceae bacterium]|jgi:hypothetical protein|nr:SPOR domain-containing protein [Flavobacteriaceae bacterium]